MKLAMTKTSVGSPGPVGDIGKIASLGNVGNIGPRGRRQRLILGTICLVLACAGLYVLARWQTPRAVRLLLFPFFWVGLVGVLQARARTCIALAARGTCDSGAGVAVLTPELDHLFRQRAKTIRRTALTLALALTLGALALP